MLMTLSEAPKPHGSAETKELEKKKTQQKSSDC